MRRKIAIEHPFELGHDLQRLVFIAGTARSGTTWLLDLLNADNSNRVIFEPFHERWGVVTGDRFPRYLRPDSDEPELVAAVERVLRGTFAATRWTGRYNTRLFARQRLIKDVHSNLRLAWLATQFPEFPILLVIRHPCAVAASRRRAGFSADFDRTLSPFFSDAELLEDYLAPFISGLEREPDDFSREITRWCIETFVALQQRERLADPGRIRVFFYERLLEDPETGVAALFEAAGRSVPIEAHRAFVRPSKTTYRERPLPAPNAAVTDWQTHVTPEEMRTALGLLELFGLHELYGEPAKPLASQSAFSQFGFAEPPHIAGPPSAADVDVSHERRTPEDAREAEFQDVDTTLNMGRQPEPESRGGGA